MAWNLTVAVPYENGQRIVCGKPHIDDDASVMVVPLELRSAPGTNYLLSRKVVTVRNGLCDRVVRVVPAVGGDASDKMSVQPNAIDVPTGFTTALAAWAGGGASSNSKRDALVSHLAAIGVIDTATFAGS